MKPSEQIQAALSGAVFPSELSMACQSAMRFRVYQIACEVLKLPSRAMQREAIERHPEQVQELIRKECRRVYDLRRG